MCYTKLNNQEIITMDNVIKFPSKLNNSPLDEDLLDMNDIFQIFCDFLTSEERTSITSACLTLFTHGNEEPNCIVIGESSPENVESMRAYINTALDMLLNADDGGE